MEKDFKSHIVIRPSLIKRMIDKSKAFIKDGKDRFNELNFFPLPDKDTGSNALVTLTAMMDAIKEKKYDNLPELIDDLLESAQDNARGNMGAAISNGFIGFFSVLREEGKSSKELAPEVWEWVRQFFADEAGKEKISEEKIKVIDGRILTKALAAGFEKAYGGFNPPEKKTVLDVMEAAKTEAEAQVKAGENDPSLILEKAIIKAREALAGTKGKIHKGKVIPTEDAGAAAFIPILKAFSEVFMEDRKGKK